MRYRKILIVISASLLWLIGVTAYGYLDQVQSGERTARFIYDSCLYVHQMEHNGDLLSCDTERKANSEKFASGGFTSGMVIAWASLPIAWLTALSLFYIFRAQYLGFRAAVPWAGAAIWKKGLVVVCALFTFATATFGLMILMNMYVDTKVPVSLSPFKPFVTWHNEYVVEAKGTWIRSDLIGQADSISYPLQTSRIRCVHELGKCFESKAYVINDMLQSDLNIYDVTSWSPTAVVFRDDSSCYSEVYTIDIAKDVVSGQGQSLNQDQDMCKHPRPFDSGKTEWSYQLADGFNVYWEARMKVRPLLLRLLQGAAGH